MITEAIESTSNGSGRVVLVVGEGGIGKTTVIREALAHAAAASTAAPVFQATGEAMDHTRPYGVLLDALQSGDASTRESARELLKTQRRLMAQGRNADFLVGEELLDLLDQVASGGPALLVLDDVHLADSESLALLSRLGRRLAQLPLAVVCSARVDPEPMALRSARTALDQRQLLTTIRLGPLSDEACAVLAEDLIGASPDHEARRQFAAADGNPLFLGELILGLQRAGAIRRTADGQAQLTTRIRRPESFAMAVMHHLGLLSQPARDLLRLAAVLGTRFSVADLRLICDLPMTDLMPALSEVTAARVIVAEDEDSLAFRHALIREVLSADTPAPVRGELHLDVARRLAADGAPAPVLAAHLLQVPVSPELVPWLLAVADECRATSLEIAMELWQRVADGPTRSARAKVLLGMAANIRGRPSEAFRLAEDALRDELPDDLYKEALATIPRALLYAGRLHEAADRADRAANDPRLHPGDRVSHLAFAGWLLFLVGDVEAARPRAVAAVRDAADLGNVPAWVLAMLLRGSIAVGEGRLDDGLADLEAATRIVEQSPSAELLGGFPHEHLAAALADVDRFDEAFRVVERSRRLAERFGLVVNTFAAIGLRADLTSLVGHVADVQAQVETRESLSDSIDLSYDAPLLATRVLTSLHSAGPEAAQPWARRLAALYPNIDQLQPRRGVVASALAAQLTLTGRPDDALDLLWTWWTQARDYARITCVRNGVQLTRLALDRDEGEMAKEVADLLAEAADRNPQVNHLRASALVASGLVTDEMGKLAAGAELFAASPRRLQYAEACEVAALRSAAGRHMRDATRWSRTALHEYQEIGAEYEVRRVRLAMRASGVQLRGSAVAPRPVTGWESLTPSEQRVARHVSTGMSNPEVADLMVLSRRTVETHMSHILAKLGVRSRAELVLYVARRSDQLAESTD